MFYEGYEIDNLNQFKEFLNNFLGKMKIKNISVRSGSNDTFFYIRTYNKKYSVLLAQNNIRFTPYVNGEREGCHNFIVKNITDGEFLLWMKELKSKYTTFVI